MKRGVPTAPSTSLAAKLANAAAQATIVGESAGADFAEIPGTPLLLSVEEGAAQLRIGRSRMFELIRQGSVLSVKVGGSRRIPYESLRSYVDHLVAEQSNTGSDVPAA